MNTKNCCFTELLINKELHATKRTNRTVGSTPLL